MFVNAFAALHKSWGRQLLSAYLCVLCGKWARDVSFTAKIRRDTQRKTKTGKLEYQACPGSFQVTLLFLKLKANG